MLWTLRGLGRDSQTPSKPQNSTNQPQKSKEPYNRTGTTHPPPPKKTRTLGLKDSKLKQKNQKTITI